jgi:hypothetical protein
MKVELSMTQEKAVTTASLSHRFELGLKHLSETAKSIEDLTSTIDMLGSMAFAQSVFDGDAGLLQKRRNQLSSLWLAALENR